MPFNLLVLSCLAYVAFLFAVAFAVERRAERGAPKWLRSPLVYTLSLSVYCTAWTFYGAVGYAARSGLEFVTIYTGPTLVFIGWWVILRKLVRIAKSQRVTSIADLISSRYGKSALLGVIVTVIGVTAATPYIALQLQSVALSFSAFVSDAPLGFDVSDRNTTALWVAAGLTLFTILFGTRNLDANEQHHGVVIAIAVEAVVKLVALIAVGIFVIWVVADGPADIFARIDASPLSQWSAQPDRWIGLTFLSATAILTLPRMFQVLVVENADERHLSTASWAFPLYLALMSLFVIPIAVIGLDLMPAQSNPDLFVLTIPLALDQGGLAMLAFLGGFSSATSMVIIAAIALATMVSNHIVMPILIAIGERREGERGDLRRAALLARRLSIAGILTLGYAYYALSGGSGALAETGLIAFVGVAQMLPAMIGGLYWRGATRTGAILGLVSGFGIWLYTLYLPSFGAGAVMAASTLSDGPWGISALRPRALFGIEGLDPLIHSTAWSLAVNSLLFCLGSLFTFPSPLERLQAAQFVNVFDRAPASGWQAGEAEAEDLLDTAQRILGEYEALNFFQAKARAQGKGDQLPDITPAFLQALERELAGSIGAAAAHAMLGQITGGTGVSVEDLMAVANETAQMLEYSAQLEHQQKELSRTAVQLREANEKLTQISVQKDAFLTQISHELRTPMTSIRAFSEILMDPDVSPQLSQRYAGIIHEEAIRLTRLLDDLLDLSVLENGTVQLSLRQDSLHRILGRAVHAAGSQRPSAPPLQIERDPMTEEIEVFTDTDRLTQVFINVISNAQKYCDAPDPRLRIVVRKARGAVEVDFIDNGSGIPRQAQSLIFEKFARLTDAGQAGGAGLGLAICREIMQNLGGSIRYLPGLGGAAFRVSFPLRKAMRH